MATPLKNLYSKKFYQHISPILAIHIPSFDEKKFIKIIFNKTWKEKELKDRMRHTALCLHQFLPKTFPKAAKMLAAASQDYLKQGFQNYGLEFMFIPDYLETYGINHFKAATKAMEKTTELTSCEFAIRPFIIKYEKEAIPTLLKWSQHKNLHLRRLASEGSRPRLPWAMALPKYKKDPKPILPILENLKTDPSEYVRRSVANNLNDISKDHPKILLSIARKWKGQSKETDAIIKHASRTLLKAGDLSIMKFYGLDNKGIEIKDLVFVKNKIKVGDYIVFQFNLSSKSSKYIRLEYAIYFLLKNGKHSKKVFKISEKEYEAKLELRGEKKHSFKPISTRTYYQGEHFVSIITNGKESIKSSFHLEL